ncbi:MAG: hypothetical protein ACFBZ8_00600 [Opitutales bacterium]
MRATTVLTRIHAEVSWGTWWNFKPDQLTAFAFHDAIEQVYFSTRDASARDIVDVLWYFYDDIDDHYIELDEQGWKFFERIRLFLASDFCSPGAFITQAYPNAEKLWPFCNVGEVLRARRAVSEFEKRAYRVELQTAGRRYLRPRWIKARDWVYGMILLAAVLLWAWAEFSIW